MSTITSEQRELLRHAILLQLERASSMGLPVGTLRLGARMAGHDVDAEHIKTELQYLEDQRLVEPTTKTISPENRRHRITADGRDYLATQGLA